MEEQQTPRPDWFTRNFNSLVMVLLVCIIFVLAGLWYLERQRRMDAYKQLNQAQADLKSVKTDLAINQQLLKMFTGSTSQPTTDK